MKKDRQKHSKESWPKAVVKKWLNIKSGTDKFYSDYSLHGKVSNTERRKSCSDQDCYLYVPQDIPGWLKEPTTNGIKKAKYESNQNATVDSLDLRMFVGTWNVGGKPPHEGLNLRDWLTTPAPSDIYVLGFQEIVPLNAGNILGAEDITPASKWLNLIRQALNPPNTTNKHNNLSSTSQPDQYYYHQAATIKPRLSFSDLLSLQDQLDNDEDSPSPPTVSGRYNNGTAGSRSRYCLAASKQMVGLFLCVWVNADIYKRISDLKVSCVGRGIMGYLGNKGSVSISMKLHDTSFCFVCTHLTSGEKEGDELKRNSDVTEILRRTRFSPRPFKGLLNQQSLSPTSILEHEKVIWLGDLNYRLAFGTTADTMELLEKNDWQPLLEKDQLRLEQKAGRVFKDWEEGSICFAPTYKYITGSDHYVAQTNKSKEKPRTPAWCDRILWKGEGLKQLWYVRGESKFSDHRPVSSLFSVPVDINNTTAALLPPLAAGNCNAKIQAEELFLFGTCLETVSEVQ